MTPPCPTAWHLAPPLLAEYAPTVFCRRAFGHVGAHLCYLGSGPDAGQPTFPPDARPEVAREWDKLKVAIEDL